MPFPYTDSNVAELHRIFPSPYSQNPPQTFHPPDSVHCPRNLLDLPTSPCSEWLLQQNSSAVCMRPCLDWYDIVPRRRRLLSSRIHLTFSPSANKSAKNLKKIYFHERKKTRARDMENPLTFGVIWIWMPKLKSKKKLECSQSTCQFPIRL